MVAGNSGYYKSALLIELGCYMHAVAMRMRDQYHASNMAIFACDINGPNRAKASLAVTTYNEMILSRRPNLNFGAYLTGQRALNLPPYV